MHILAFGDIHGNIKALDAALKSIEKLVSKDSLFVFLGDYVNYGLHTKQVIDRLIDIKKNSNAVFLMGNHESALLKYISGEDIDIDGMAVWATLSSYGINSDSAENLLNKMPKEHLEFLNSTIMYYETDQYFFCHAGPCSAQKLEEQRSPMSDEVQYTMLWGDKSFHEDGLVYESDKFIIYGHYHGDAVGLTGNRKICAAVQNSVGVVSLDDNRKIIGFDDKLGVVALNNGN
jgi:serine/threonine protein phosphatase 1